MAVAVPIIGYALGAASGAMVGTTALAVGFVAAAVTTYGIAAENKDAMIIGSLIGLGAGALSGTSAAGATSAAEASTTEAMTQATVAGTDPTVASGTGLPAEVQTIPAADPQAGISVTPNTVSGELAADVGGISASPTQNLSKTGIIDSASPSWDQPPSFGSSQTPTETSSLGATEGDGILDRIMNWGKENPKLASSLVNIGGSALQKGFGYDAQKENAENAKRRTQIELDVLNARLARQNYVPGIGFRANTAANPYQVPQQPGVINRAMT